MKTPKRDEEKNKMLDTEKGCKCLVDIKGRKLKVGQHVVFSEKANHTQLMSGTILIVSPKSVYIQKDPEYTKDLKKWESPKCTKHLLANRHQYNTTGDPNYNRIEVCII